MTNVLERGGCLTGLDSGTMTSRPPNFRVIDELQVFDTIGEILEWI
jgi:hypothetical protein